MSHRTNTPPTDRSEYVELSENDRHRLLASERRRRALQVLSEQRLPVELETLAAGVADREPGSDDGDADAADRVAISLYHTHLPMMDDLGVIDFDADANRVETLREEW